MSTEETENKEQEQETKIDEEKRDKWKETLKKKFDFVKVKENEYKEKQKEYNNLVDIHNLISPENIILDYNAEEIKLKLNNQKLNVPEVQDSMKAVQGQINKLLEISAKQYVEEKVDNDLEENEIDKTKITKNKNMIDCFKQLKLNKVSNWDNIFNKFDDKNYCVNREDLDNICNYYLDNKKNTLKDCYFISDFDDNYNIDLAKDIIKNNKILFGNYLKSKSNCYNFCIIPNNNKNLVLVHESGEDKNNLNDLNNLLKSIIENKYDLRINKKNNNKEKTDENLLMIENIENNNIIMNEIANNKEKFIKNFEKYSDFCNSDNEKLNDVKKNKYPEYFIKGEYLSYKKTLNCDRISIGLFHSYYEDEKKNNEINFEFLSKLYKILKGWDYINDYEKEQLKKEYNDIKDKYIEANPDTKIEEIEDIKDKQNDKNEINVIKKQKENEDIENNKDKIENENKNDKNKEDKINNKVKNNENDENKKNKEDKLLKQKNESKNQENKENQKNKENIKNNENIRKDDLDKRNIKNDKNTNVEISNINNINNGNENVDIISIGKIKVEMEKESYINTTERMNSEENEEEEGEKKEGTENSKDKNKNRKEKRKTFCGKCCEKCIMF